MLVTTVERLQADRQGLRGALRSAADERRERFDSAADLEGQLGALRAQVEELRGAEAASVQKIRLREQALEKENADLQRKLREAEATLAAERSKSAADWTGEGAGRLKAGCGGSMPGVERLAPELELLWIARVRFNLRELPLWRAATGLLSSISTSDSGAQLPSFSHHPPSSCSRAQRHRRAGVGRGGGAARGAARRAERAAGSRARVAGVDWRRPGLWGPCRGNLCAAAEPPPAHDAALSVHGLFARGHGRAHGRLVPVGRQGATAALAQHARVHVTKDYEICCCLCWLSLYINDKTFPFLAFH